MKLTFLGQSGFILEDVCRVVVDPFLGPLEDPAERERFPRLCDPPVAAADLAALDVVLVSHHHGDHCHVATLREIAARSLSCRFISTASSRDLLVAAGIAQSRITVPQLPGWITVSDVRVFVIPAAHYEFSDRVDVVFDYFGFVVETSSCRLYFACDTIPYNGLYELVRSLGVSIAFLPVNGRDVERERLGIVGNLTAGECAAFARHCEFSWVVPCHFGMFAANTVEISDVADLFRRECPRTRTWFPAAGDSHEF